MPKDLKPNPAIPGSVTTAIDPIYADKKQIAQMFSVSQRTIDYWREGGFLPYIRVRGTVRFDVEQCREAMKKRFTHHEEGELWTPASKGRKAWKKKSKAA